ncbi:uncharacterized protein V6R79_021110 [Siganus canaliculatus]
MISNSSDSDSLTNSAKLCVLGLLLPIPVFAIIGNLLIMAAVVRFQSLQTPTNAFVVSLAVADFLVAVLVMPFSLVRSVDTWHFGGDFCRGHFLLDVTLSTSSIFNLSCVALDRYVAVCDPLHYPARMSRRRVAALLLLCWILPLVLSALCVSLGMYAHTPVAEVSNSTQQGGHTCQATFHVPYAFATSATSFFFPVGFMLFAYGKILKAAHRQVRCIHAIDHHTGKLRMNQGPFSSDSSRHVQTRTENYSQRKEWKAVKTLGLIMGVFLVCWLPFFCMNMVHPLTGYNISPVILDVSMWLGYANSSLNPFIYVLFNKNYRHAFSAMLHCGSVGGGWRGLDSSTFGRQTHAVEMLETISR